MLSLFPQILFLSPLGITLLRAVAGIYFIYIAYGLLLRRSLIERSRLPVVGHPSEWMVYFSALIALSAGVLLTAGLWTQAAAILGALIALKHAFVSRWYPSVLPFPTSTTLLLCALCLALIVTGPGLFAFDLPL